MMILRKAGERGVTDFGWLDSKHTFSFGGYHDPDHHQYRTLRVINDDRVAPGGGFDTHGHRDMEIFTYVLSGALEHKDSLGTGSTIRAGEWQAMSAGTGVLHSEFNPSATEPVHLLQMWIFPKARGLKPMYQQKSFEASPGTWTLALSPDGEAGSMVIHQDAKVWNAKLNAGQQLRYEATAGRGVWLHVATGAVIVNGQVLQAGDAAQVEGEALELLGEATGEVILFDLA
ncbi:MAG: pirin family protein [Fimbriiglobus sp.]